MSSDGRPTRDGVEIIHSRFFEGQPVRLAELDEARASAAIARQVYELREKAGLSRCELAREVGTTQTTIRDIEEDAGEGRSLEMIRKIARALGRRVEIRLLPTRGKRKPA
jgi:DNA-binding XRE family transcriptional regulator